MHLLYNIHDIYVLLLSTTKFKLIFTLSFEAHLKPNWKSTKELLRKENNIGKHKK